MVLHKVFLAVVAAVVVSGCSFPAGAPIQSEVTAEANSTDPSYSVVEVTRANLPRLAEWPSTGWKGHYRWLQSGGGSSIAVLRPGDTINLVIWDNQTNSLLTNPSTKSTAMRDIRVSPAGTIFVPYVGEVVVNGLSPDSARREVQKEMERIAPSAQVQLEYSAGSSNTVDLVRGVANPGPVQMESRNMTILSLISEGGGISTKLRNPLVRLIRSGKTYEIRADDLLSNAQRNIVVRGGDKIIIDEDERFFVAAGATGDRIVNFDREHITVIEALSMAGGLTETRADPEGVLILRDYPAEAIDPRGNRGPEMRQVVFTVDLTSADGLFAAREFLVNPGDLVMATESPMIGVSSMLGLVSELLLLRSRI